MVELFDTDIVLISNKSSKGNQLKWHYNDYWYKADFTGYEGLTEYLTSKMLSKSSLSQDEFVSYDLETIKYGKNIFLGCKSKHFLREGQSIITCERLYKNYTATSLYETLYKIPDEEERFDFLVNQIERITGLKAFSEYMNKIMTIDALCLNEDRHLHNVAVILNADGSFEYCPLFDQGAGLLSDTTLDYPLTGDLYEMIDDAKAKTFSDDFDRQLEISEKRSKKALTFHFDKKDVREWVAAADIYPEAIRDRVEKIIYDRMRKYGYLFNN